MSELKPCPFCGGGAVVVQTRYRHGEEYFFVKCNNKDCPVIPETYENTEMKDAIEAWNGRAENEELKFTRQFIHEHGLDFALASAWKGRAEDGK